MPASFITHQHTPIHPPLQAHEHTSRQAADKQTGTQADPVPASAARGQGVASQARDNPDGRSGSCSSHPCSHHIHHLRPLVRPRLLLRLLPLVPARPTGPYAVPHRAAWRAHLVDTIGLLDASILLHRMATRRRPLVTRGPPKPQECTHLHEGAEKSLGRKRALGGVLTRSTCQRTEREATMGGKEVGAGTE